MREVNNWRNMRKNIIVNINLTDKDLAEALEADVTEVIEKYGFKLLSDEMTIEQDELNFYPEDVLCPKAR